MNRMKLKEFSKNRVSPRSHTTEQAPALTGVVNPSTIWCYNLTRITKELPKGPRGSAFPLHNSKSSLVSDFPPYDADLSMIPVSKREEGLSDYVLRVRRKW